MKVFLGYRLISFWIPTLNGLSLVLYRQLGTPKLPREIVEPKRTEVLESSGGEIAEAKSASAGRGRSDKIEEARKNLRPTWPKREPFKKESV